MQPTQPDTHEPRTLRDFGFSECSHPDGSIAYDRGELHCGYCGATKIGMEWRGGSVDYKIDLVILRLRGEVLKKNLQDEQSS